MTAVRVALLTYSTRPRGGVVHTLALAEALARRGADVTVHTLDRSGDGTFYRPVADDVRTVVTPVRASEDESFTDRILRSIAVLGEAVDPTAHDVVHAQDCIAANAVGGRCVRTVHHLDAFTTPALVACHARAVTEPAHLVCVSHAVAAEVARDWGRQPTVIPNGVDAARFEAAAGEAGAAARGAWRAELGAPLIVTVGGIEPRKGTVDLIDVLARLRRCHPTARLAIAGGETLFDYRPYRREFDRRLAASGLAHAVEVLGPVADDRLPSLVAAADAFVLASTKEGFGLVALEALAAGVPTVVRDLPVFHEVLGDAVGYGGDAVGLADALDGVLGATDLPARHRGREVARRFTWDIAARRHLELYAQLDADARGGPAAAGVVS